MDFMVVSRRTAHPSNPTSTVVLSTDGWDDWFKFGTMYNVSYYDDAGAMTRIGAVKIGQFEMADGQYRPDIPDSFTELDVQFFSVGQDDSYYQALNEIGAVFREDFLKAMRDIARDDELLARALGEDVTNVSLLRSVSEATIRGQYRRMTRGEARLTAFAFKYSPPPDEGKSRTPTFEFEVVPESSPPTNVHVLIGRNGVGKTHTVNLMTNALVRPSEDDTDFGSFAWDDEDEESGFPNVVSVTFSAFDPFEPISNRMNKSTGPRYNYIGLKHTTKDPDGGPKPPKSPDDLASDFGRAVQMIVQHDAKQIRWRRVLELLESDRIFRRAEVWRLIEDYAQLLETYEQRPAMTELRKLARGVFTKLSSGHKIVLLTVTCLVEALEERTLVMLDEPEAHLHPPLLSAFIRAPSALLIDRNGVAIIATHSPVILQEVPRTCVWRIRRANRSVRIERPKRETFGENVAALNQEIFGLEVTESGFHRLLSEAVREGLTYDQVLARFGGQLGDEARAVALSLIATSDGAE